MTSLGTIPAELRGQRYISLTTFKKDGTGVPTPIWLAENEGKLYVMTRSDSWKIKRIRNNARVQVAPCTMRGTVTGPKFEGKALILPEQQWAAVRKLLEKKYWLMKLPFWSKQNVFVEISL